MFLMKSVLVQLSALLKNSLLSGDPSKPVEATDTETKICKTWLTFIYLKEQRSELVRWDQGRQRRTAENSLRLKTIWSFLHDVAGHMS